MKTQNGYLQAYNAQAVVNTDQVIVAAGVTNEANDLHQLHPMMEVATANLEAIGSRPNRSVSCWPTPVTAARTTSTRQRALAGAVCGDDQGLQAATGTGRGAQDPKARWNDADGTRTDGCQAPERTRKNALQAALGDRRAPPSARSNKPDRFASSSAEVKPPSTANGSSSAPPTIS